MSVVVGSPVVIVRRTIAASAEELFDAWLDPEALAIWMRPGTILATEAKVDARVGGRYEIIMRGESNTFPHTGEYRVIDRPRRIVFTWKSRGTDLQETLVTVDFLRADRRTEVIVTHEKLPEAERDSHTRGWTSGLEKLAQFREPA